MRIIKNLFLIVLGVLNCVKFLMPENPLDLKIIGAIFIIFLGAKSFYIKKYNYGFGRQVFTIIFFTLPAMLPWPLLRIFAFIYVAVTIYYLEKPGNWVNSTDYLFERTFDIREEDWAEVEKLSSLWEKEQKIKQIRQKYKDEERERTFWEQKYNEK